MCAAARTGRQFWYSCIFNTINGNMYLMQAKRVLVVDDEPDIVELVGYNLKKEGYSVSSAIDGEEALNKIRNGNFDVMVLDLMLPGIQGVELCRILRNDPKTKKLPIIMLTAR